MATTKPITTHIDELEANFNAVKKPVIIDTVDLKIIAFIERNKIFTVIVSGFVIFAGTLLIYHNVVLSTIVSVISMLAIGIFFKTKENAAETNEQPCNKPIDVIEQQKIDITRLIHLKEKYCKYDKDCADFKRYYESLPHRGCDYKDLMSCDYFDLDSPQCLYDALSTGCDLPPQRSLYTFTSETEKDIRDLVRLCPSSLYCIAGILRCKKFVTPLYIACRNDKIPIHIIEFLLKNGAIKNTSIYVSNKKTHILEDLRDEISEERFDQISSLFLKYGITED